MRHSLFTVSVEDLHVKQKVYLIDEGMPGVHVRWIGGVEYSCSQPDGWKTVRLSTMENLYDPKPAVNLRNIFLTFEDAKAELMERAFAKLDAIKELTDAH